MTTDPAPLAGRRFHMLGIGGAGVSALAQLCARWGAEVDGCDRAGSGYSRMVERQGIAVRVGHDPAHVEPGMELVASSALPADQPELVRARELGLPVRLRGELLGELTRLRRTVVVAGAHGKSTTTSMIAHAAVAAGLDPSVAIGATVTGLAHPGEDSNVRVGDGEWFVVEGDESDRTLLGLAAEVGVVTNIERDHHHTFASDEEVYELFARWVADLPAGATLVAGPGAVLDRLAADAVRAGRAVVRFGRDEDELAAIAKRLPVPGRHNALNAAAALAALGLMGADRDAALDALAGFPGVGRRFQHVGATAGVDVVDDYAHHPTEVAATIEAARRAYPDRRLVVVFQPHLYSRTRELHREFAAALGSADLVHLLPIYGAREEPLAGVDVQLIERGMLAMDVSAGVDLVDLDPAAPEPQVVESLVRSLEPGDVVVTMGAGSITELAPQLVGHLALLNRRPPAPRRDVPPPAWIEQDVSLARFTTIGTGGPARWLARAGSEEQLQEALAWARAANVPFAMLGLGSNTLIVDEGFDGLAIKLVDDLARIDIDEQHARVTCGGGASLAAIVRRCRDVGLTGIEFGCAIPGTVGGAVKMNAGAYGGEIRDVLAEAHVTSAGGVRSAGPDDLQMTYRHSNIGWDEVVSEAVLQLAPGDPAEVTATVKRMQGQRSDTQPRAARTFGSVFQNPASPAEADAAAERPRGAGALVEAAGLKGHVIGGACISPKHGNFIENTGGASTADIIALIELARAAVLEQFGVTLHTEVHLLDTDGYRPLHDDRALVR